MNPVPHIVALLVVALVSMLSYSPTSATSLPLQLASTSSLEEAPVERTRIILIITRKGKYAEVQALKPFSSDGGLGGTRIAAEAEVRDNRIFVHISAADASRLAQLSGIGMSAPLRLSPKLSSQLGHKGVLTLRAGKFTDMDKVKEKRMLWFEIQ